MPLRIETTIKASSSYRWYTFEKQSNTLNPVPLLVISNDDDPYYDLTLDKQMALQLAKRLIDFAVED